MIFIQSVSPAHQQLNLTNRWVFLWGAHSSIRLGSSQKQKLLRSEGHRVPSSAFVSPTSQLTRVFCLEVGLALQCWWQVVEAERQLPLKGRVLLAEGRESPERALTHQLLDGRVAARDSMRPAGFWPLHGGRRTLGWGSSARWKGWDCRRLVWRRKWIHGHFCSRRTAAVHNLLIIYCAFLCDHMGSIERHIWVCVCTLWNILLPFFLSGSLSSRSLLLPCWLQEELARKEPSRTNEVRLASKEAVTPHSFSLRCFLSKQAAKAQPTAWLSLSPCGAKKQWI